MARKRMEDDGLIEGGGQATEARNLLFSCLRFAPRDEYGNTRDERGRPIEGDPIPYDGRWDDRDPVAFVMPPDVPYSPGPNRLWNTIASLPILDTSVTNAVETRDEAIALLRVLLDTEASETKLRMAAIRAARWLAEWDRED